MMLACRPCGTFYKILRSGVSVEEGMPNGSGGWQPYKLWQADLYKCEGCGAEVIAGFGRQPISEHYMSDYARLRAQVERDLTVVNDCTGQYRAGRIDGKETER